jgi:Putative peptidoglycan binding domain
MSACRYYRRVPFAPSLLILLVLAGSVAILAQTDNNITQLQNQLKAEGFYSGDPTGVLDGKTKDALTGYQVRHSLVPTGKLDAPTIKLLKASATPAPVIQAPPGPGVLNGSWRRLPGGELEFVNEQPAPTPSPSAANRSPASPPAEGPAAPTTAPKNPPPPPMTPVSPSSQPPRGSPGNVVPAENLRDFVENFLQAGLALPLGSEAKFFSERVDYLGTPGVLRQDVQRDLVRYDRKWPHRRFWIDGDIQIEQPGGNEIKIAFPLRYELRNGSRYATGKVLKSLTLLRTATNELQIIAVSESSL